MNTGRTKYDRIVVNRQIRREGSRTGRKHRWHRRYDGIVECWDCGVRIDWPGARCACAYPGRRKDYEARGNHVGPEGDDERC
jgi:hypothetical protein